MTAEIIQFGRAPSSGAKLKAEPIAMARATSQAKPLTEAIRCTVDGKLYEVKFRGKAVCKISAISYRHNRRNGRIETCRLQHWSPNGYSRHDCDPKVVEAAWRVRDQGGGNESDAEMVMSQLRERHARLLREAEKVGATIAALEAQSIPR